MGINLKTCSDTSVCQKLKLCPHFCLTARLFYFTLESLVSFEVYLMNVLDLGMQMIGKAMEGEVQEDRPGGLYIGIKQ